MSGNRERFLVAMPTRHREALVQKSLTGLLPLLGDGVRLLVSDNSDTPSAALQAFSKANGVDYVRPDRVLRMTEHWNWIIGSQDYKAITITTDRSTLWLDVYREAKALAERVGHAVVTGDATYIRKSRFGLPFGVLSAQVKSGAIYDVPASAIRQAVYKELVHTALPLPQNSIIHRAEIEAIYAKFGDLNSIAPDYELGYKYVHTLRDGHVTVLDKAMTISHSKELSNGGGIDSKVKNDAATDFLRLNAISSFHFSPIPDDINSFSAVAHELNKVLIESGEQPLIDEGVLRSSRSRVVDRQPSFLARRKAFLMTLLGLDPDHLLRIRLGYDPLDAQRIVLPVNPKLTSYRPFFI